MIAVDRDLAGETERLFRLLLPVDCEPGRPWDYEACRRIAPLTLEINRLKREIIELRNVVQTALLVVHAASLNPISKGCHYIVDESGVAAPGPAPLCLVES